MPRTSPRSEASRARRRRRLALAAAGAAAFGALGTWALFWGGSGGPIELALGHLPPRERIPPAGAPAAGSFAVALELRSRLPVARVAPEFLSFGFDSAQLVGGMWWDPTASRVEYGSGSVPTRRADLGRPRLDLLARGLAPAWLRVGGSEADRIHYDLAGELAPGAPPPDECDTVLDAERWAELEAFARRAGLRALFTLNAGPGARRADGSWDPAHAEGLVAHAARLGTAVELWELGNELNVFWAVHGPLEQVSPRQYADDLRAARALLARHLPEARLAGQGSAYWPLLGEPLALLFSFTGPYLERGGDAVDVVNWHYYPQQSRRGFLASRRAHPARLLAAGHLDEARRWARAVVALRDEHAPGKPVWLGETGNAQFCGEPGVSDAWIGSLWWLDQLGLMAREGVEVVVRHTLAGLDYGLVDERTLEPRPDYWSSLLWKRRMGGLVLDLRKRGEEAERLRAYAHAPEDGELAIFCINLDPRRRAKVALPELGAGERYALAAPDPLGREVRLNDAPLALRPDGGLPEIHGVPFAAGEALELEPLACAFVVFAADPHAEHARSLRGEDDLRPGTRVTRSGPGAGR